MAAISGSDDGEGDGVGDAHDAPVNVSRTVVDAEPAALLCALLGSVPALLRAAHAVSGDGRVASGEWHCLVRCALWCMGST